MGIELRVISAHYPIGGCRQTDHVALVAPRRESGSPTDRRLRDSRGTLMAYGVVHFFPGATREQYDASIAAVHPADGSLPQGQTFHAAGASEGGWTIMAVQDSRESWEQFRDSVLIPRMQQGIDCEFQTPPEETGIELYSIDDEGRLLGELKGIALGREKPPGAALTTAGFSRGVQPRARVGKAKTEEPVDGC
jgi:hypothetical protein